MAPPGDNSIYEYIFHELMDQKETRDDFHKVKNIVTKLENKQSTILFLQTCLEEKIIPPTQKLSE